MRTKLRTHSDPVIYPTFPLNCDFCEATHGGGVEQAVDDGWNFAVFDVKNDGRVQMAGCPKHSTEISEKMLNFIQEKTAR